jgi:hypothetical protein
MPGGDPELSPFELEVGPAVAGGFVAVGAVLAGRDLPLLGYEGGEGVEGCAQMPWPGISSAQFCSTSGPLQRRRGGLGRIGSGFANGEEMA